MLLKFVVNLVLFWPTFETPINTEEALAQGIIFHKEGKILITEKFINAEFLGLFPRYNFTVRQQVETPLHELSTKRGLHNHLFVILHTVPLTKTKQMFSMLTGSNRKSSTKQLQQKSKSSN